MNIQSGDRLRVDIQDGILILLPQPLRCRRAVAALMGFEPLRAHHSTALGVQPRAVLFVTAPWRTDFTPGA